MPSVSLPVLAIKEANDHLQALFNENQSLEIQLDDHKTLLAEKEEENKKCTTQVNSLTEQVSNLMGQLNDMRIAHKKEISSIRDSLNSEYTESLKVVTEKHSGEISNLRDEHEKELNKLKESLESSFEVKLSEQEDFYKQEIEDTITKENQLAKIDKQKSLHELEVTLKHEEKEKVEALQEKIESHQNEIKILQSEIDRLSNYLLRNTKKRETKIEILSKVFKSTVENMSLCLEIVNEEEFINSSKLTGNNLCEETIRNVESSKDETILVNHKEDVVSIGQSSEDEITQSNDLVLHDSGFVIEEVEPLKRNINDKDLQSNYVCEADGIQKVTVFEDNSLCNGFHSESDLQ